MLIGSSDGNRSQYIRIMELLPAYYPVQEDEFDFKVSEAFDQVMRDKDNRASLKKWKGFLRQVKTKAKAGLRVSSSQYLMEPSFKGVFSLKKEKIGQALYEREFVVYLSLIGNFYAMYGLDTITLEDEVDGQEIWFEPVIYPFPHSIYKAWFFLFRQAMQEAYADYEFVPYQTLSYRLKGVSTGIINDELADPSIFQALFAFEDINRYRVQIDREADPFTRGYGFD